MKTLRENPWLVVAVVGLFAGGPAWAQTGAEEAQLATAGHQVEQAMAAKPEVARAELLAKQYQVEPSVVEGLRNKNRGWGEINTELAMAEQLTKNDPNTYPSLTESLRKIDAMRDEGQGWGKIANDLGFKLGPVVSEAQHAQRELRAEANAGSARPEKVGRPNRPERPERPEKFSRPERPDKPNQS